MANKGFSIKVKKVANGYTVHTAKTGVPNAEDDHEDYVATTAKDLRGLLLNEIDAAITELGRSK